MENIERDHRVPMQSSSHSLRSNWWLGNHLINTRGCLAIIWIRGDSIPPGETSRVALMMNIY